MIYWLQSWDQDRYVVNEGTMKWRTPSQSQLLTKDLIIVGQGSDLFGQHQYSRPLGGSNTNSQWLFDLLSNLADMIG